MPLCAVRQWNALNGALAVRHGLCRPQYSFSATLATSRRRFATRPQPEPQVTESTSTKLPSVRRHKSLTLIPHPVKVNDLHAFIKRFPRLSTEDIPANNFCVCFVTPSFASWLAQDSSFLEQVLRKRYHWAFNGPGLDMEIHALFAVVDKIPVPEAVSQHRSLEEEAFARSRDWKNNDTGFEGVSLTSLSASGSIPSTSPKHPENGAIDFTIFDHSHRDGTGTVSTWRLPLANTIFQTGSSSTMIYSRWKASPENVSLSLISKENVSHHGIDMVTSASPAKRISALRVPLVPLTHVTDVHEFMGNIVRSVRGPDGVVMEAAAELERRVPSYFKSIGQESQPTTVWALVIPKYFKARNTARMSRRMMAERKQEQSEEDAQFERMWKTLPSVLDRLVSRGLEEGARLHRVLSGGGGWGKKKGLLSLDPVPVNEELPIRMEDATSASDGPGDFMKALKPVVKEGDSIQFFIAPKPAVEEEAEVIRRLKLIHRTGVWGLRLGTIPSTIDTMPGGTSQQTSSEGPFIREFPYAFGALSERGLTLTRRSRGTPEKPGTVLSTSTVDVPFTRLWVVEEEGTDGGSFGKRATKDDEPTSNTSLSQETRVERRPMREAATVKTRGDSHRVVVGEPTSQENQPSARNGIAIRRVLGFKLREDLEDPDTAFQSMQSLVNSINRPKVRRQTLIRLLQTLDDLTGLRRIYLKAQLLKLRFHPRFQNALVASETILKSQQEEFDKVSSSMKPKTSKEKVHKILREFEKSHRSKIQGSKDLRDRRLADKKSFLLRMKQKQQNKKLTKQRKRPIIQRKTRTIHAGRFRIVKQANIDLKRRNAVPISKYVSKKNSRLDWTSQERPIFYTRRVSSSPRRLTQKAIEQRKAKKEELANAVQSWLL